MHRASVKAFDLFNSFNDDDEFNVHCRRVARIGTHIKKRVCKPNYVADLVAKETAASLGGRPSLTLMRWFGEKMRFCRRRWRRF